MDRREFLKTTLAALVLPSIPVAGAVEKDIRPYRLAELSDAQLQRLIYIFDDLVKTSRIRTIMLGTVGSHANSPDYVEARRREVVYDQNLFALRAERIRRGPVRADSKQMLDQLHAIYEEKARENGLLRQDP